MAFAKKLEGWQIRSAKSEAGVCKNLPLGVCILEGPKLAI